MNINTFLCLHGLIRPTSKSSGTTSKIVTQALVKKPPIVKSKKGCKRVKPSAAESPPVIEKESGIKNFSKTTIADSRNSCIQLVKTENDVKNQIKILVNAYFETKKQIQPLIFVVGKSFSTATTFYVYFCNILYQLPTFLKALDVCFKTYFVFNFSYPNESILIWNFLQIFFYEITTSNDSRNSRVKSRINDLKLICKS